MINRIKRAFSERFAGDPLLVRSPARVNLLGEHTDYNEGFVLPAAVNKSIVFAIAPRNDHRCRIVAVDLRETHEFDIETLKKSDRGWPNYLIGVVDQLRKAGFDVGGFDCAFGGDIPIAAGMSSSAAIEGGLAFALNELFQFDIDTLTLVKLAQKAENEFVGVRCGIMDQFINLFGREHNVVRLDCRSLEFEYIPFDREDLRIVLCDTRVKRELASSEYNVRRQQCESGVRVLQRSHPDIRSLRDVSPELLEDHRSELDPVVFRRCDFVIRENARVLSGCDDLRRKDVVAFGQRMYGSHAGLRDGYEVSCPELDLLVDTAMNSGGVLGARMMGAGFGGCTINLMEETDVESFLSSVRESYRAKFGCDIAAHIAHIQSGTRRVTNTNVTV